MMKTQQKNAQTVIITYNENRAATAATITLAKNNNEKNIVTIN